MNAASSIDERVQLAIKEIERTGAFTRKAICILIPTGTGWINPEMADSFEYVENGDSAIISVQYSYLPSWISFLVDKSRATEAGEKLIDGVYDKWSTLAETKRPKLYVAGLSLGSYGAQAAFSGSSDIRTRTNGALLVGTPNDTGLWRDITGSRNQGSPERLPIYKDRETVRFTDSLGIDEVKPDDWDNPRILYIQNASDPIVWWTPSLIFRKPDWLSEPRGADVLTSTGWYPFVSFSQISFDQMIGTEVPDGHGHNYKTPVADGWVIVVKPDGWDDEKREQLEQLMATYQD